MSENPRKSQKKYWILFTVLLLLAAALILPPLINLNRYQRRIADAISNGLGRPVHLSSVTLRLLPRPGLELSDFIVDEDPAFGAEPTLRAQNVDASIRLSSLWRGRLEIGRISLDQPSLNLVRNSEDRWNIGTVLLQASRIPNAPTAQRRASSAPRFPYIEASNARVNFKFGNEKKPFSLLNADFAMWLNNPDEWRIRLEAQPARTDLDLDLSDTGLLRVEGSLHRASVLGSMPIDLQTEWSNAPLGQMGRLLLGKDTGWRGDLQVNASIKGDLYNPEFKTRVQIAGMHRQEFTPLDAFNVDATCQGQYRHALHSLDGLTCLWPIGGGHLLLTGGIPNVEQLSPAFNLQVQNVPATFGLSILRLFHDGFASSTQVSGTMQGSLEYASLPAKTLIGGFVIDGLTLHVPNTDAPFVLPALHIATPQAASAPRRVKKPHPVTPVPALLHLDSANVALGGEAPLAVSGDFTRQGFVLHFNGDASIERLRPLVAGFGVLHQSVSALAPQGSANLNLTIHGPWLPQTSSLDNPAPTAVTEGTLRLAHTEFQANFLPEPVEIVSAQAALTNTQIVWNPAAVVFHKMPLALSVTMPLACSTASCASNFSLSTPNLDAAALQSALLGAGEHGELLQQILARLDRNKVQWPPLTGTVRAGSFALGSLVLRDASASLHIEGRQIQFTSIDAHALNGILHATGSVDAAGSTPRYSFDTQLLHANAAAVSGLWHDVPPAPPSLAGIVSASAKVDLSGYSADNLAQSARGTFHWDWTQGALGLAPAALTHFDHWSADGAIKNTQLVLDHSQVTRGPLKEPVSGTISFDRKLNLTVASQDEETHVAKVVGQHAPSP
jgi:AsmA family/AsmA-like C-terminal region